MIFASKQKKNSCVKKMIFSPQTKFHLKLIFVSELELNSEHAFLLNFKNNNNIEQTHCLPNKKYFITSLKVPVKIETGIKKWND